MKTLSRLIFMLLVITLTACGGGGDGGGGGGSDTFTVSGSVSGLNGTVIVKLISYDPNDFASTHSVEEITVTQNGSYSFAENIPSGYYHSASVFQNPSGQVCTLQVENFITPYITTNISDANVTCGDGFTIGGTVSGLLGDNQGNIWLYDSDTASYVSIIISADGTFTSTASFIDGAPYILSIRSQPTNRSCVLTNGSGSISGANITNLSVVCENLYQVSGTITGYVGGFGIYNNGVEDYYLSGEETFTLNSGFLGGDTYNIAILASRQNCSVLNGTGTVSGADITDVNITCVPDNYTVSGSVSGLTGTLVLENNLTDSLNISANGVFAFSNLITLYSSYDVTIATQPAGQFCAVTEGSQQYIQSDVTSVDVVCNDFHTIGGTVSGLTIPLDIQNNSGDTLTLSADGSFQFSTTFLEGSSYNVTIPSQVSGQVCSVNNGSGSVSTGDVTSVGISCLSGYNLGGAVTGLVGSIQVQNNGADALTINADGNYNFSSFVANSASYNITIESQPAGYACVVNNGSGVISSADVTNANISCAPHNVVLTDLGITRQLPSIVEMPIHVSDKVTGLSVSGLNTSDFAVLEDGAAVGVESFVKAETVGDLSYTLRTLVVFDISSSISALDFADGKAALKNYAANMGDNQELAIYTFDDVVTRVQDYKGVDIAPDTTLETAINNITRGGGSTNLFGAIKKAADERTSDIFDVEFGVKYHTMLIITDGDDTSGYVTKTSAKTAVQNKKAFVVPVGSAATVGSAAYLSLAEIFGESQILPGTTSYSVLDETLNDVRSDLLEYFNGLYFVYYATPSRTGTPTIELSVVGNTNLDTNAVVTGSFSTSLFSSVIPSIVFTGDASFTLGSSIVWQVETLWSNDLDAYTWSAVDPSGILSITVDPLDNSKATITNTGGSTGPIDITITDPNWSISTTQTVTIQ